MTQLKQIDRVLDEKPVLNDNMIKLAQWMKTGISAPIPMR